MCPLAKKLSIVSRLIYRGYPLEGVRRMAGHSSIKVTERHYYEQLRERRGRMLSELETHMTKSESISETGVAAKTSRENG